MSVCSKKCRDCIYASAIGGDLVVCNYILVTGQRRGCDAGQSCERYIKGVRCSTIDNSIFRGAAPPKPRPKTRMTAEERREMKKKYRLRTQSICQGRQKAAIREFCDRTGWTYTQIANALGVSQTAVAYWAKEYSPAKWDKLAKLGIVKPEFPGEVDA